MTRPFFFSLTLYSALSFAHGMRTGFLEIHETSPGTAIVTWKISVNDSLTTPELPSHCSPTQSADVGSGTRTYTMQCSKPLAGSTLSIRGMGTLITETIVRVKLADGTASSVVLTKGSPTWEIPQRQSAAGVTGKYIKLGIRHIFEGWDHILFVIGLFFLVTGYRRLIATCTCFTFAHSLSLALVTFDLIQIAPPVAEACIALSLVLVALDMGRKPPLAKEGASAAFVFGLVHGLGFAGALSEIGLPADGIPFSLLGFNLGVELWQMAILLLLTYTLILARRFRLEPIVIKAAIYSVGGLGAFWFIERAAACLGFV